MKIKKKADKVLDSLAALLVRGLQLADVDDEFCEECFLSLAQIRATLEELAYRQRYKKVRK